MWIDVELARAHTPGTRDVVHLNNAGSSLSPDVVVETVIGHVRREAAIGGYEAANEAADRLQSVYDDVGALIGCGRHEIALVESATAAWNAAFWSVPFGSGDRIITARSEYPSNAVNFLLACERNGAEIVLIDDDEDGQISLDALRDAIDENSSADRAEPAFFMPASPYSAAFVRLCSTHGPRRGPGPTPTRSRMGLGGSRVGNPALPTNSASVLRCATPATSGSTRSVNERLRSHVSCGQSCASWPTSASTTRAFSSAES